MLGNSCDVLCYFIMLELNDVYQVCSGILYINRSSKIVGCKF